MEHKRLRIEKWKWIPGYRDQYKISSIGRVKSVTRLIPYSGGPPRRKKGQLLKANPTRAKGYMSIQLQVESRFRTYLVHVIVCTVFNGPKPTQRHRVNHVNGKKWDNRMENLEWLTQKQNVRHAMRLGLFQATRQKGLRKR